MVLQSKFARGSLRGFAAAWLAKFVVAGIFVFVGCGPLGPIPGGALSGELGSADAADWSFGKDLETAQLETRRADPHAVNT